MERKLIFEKYMHFMFLKLSLLDMLQVYLKWLVMVWKLTHGL